MYLVLSARGPSWTHRKFLPLLNETPNFPCRLVSHSTATLAHLEQPRFLIEHLASGTSELLLLPWNSLSSQKCLTSAAAVPAGLRGHRDLIPKFSIHVCPRAYLYNAQRSVRVPCAMSSVNHPLRVFWTTTLKYSIWSVPQSTCIPVDHDAERNRGTWKRFLLYSL